MIPLIFIYFKIARVHNKEERLTLLWKAQHILVLIVAVFTYIYAFNHMAWYILLLVSFLSFIMASMLITAIQLGIFVNGKPLFGMNKVYKYTNYLTLLLYVLGAILSII
ncbi:hypothetical protein MNB_SV-14-423 [hydrothermal vent metagenome]|uniref:Uncharacterized protein n=1 Tax=hydrothermal vent metagenome TaxID=652676 RepID=A0A1W1CQ69_9ZZZZ